MGQRRSSHTSSSAGFSLVELIIVLAILAAAYSMAMPSYKRTATKPSLRAAAIQVAADLRAVRAHAIARNQDVALVVDLTSQTYTTPLGNPKAVPRGIALSFQAAQDMPRRPFDARVIFYPSGGSSGGRIVLSSIEDRVVVSVDWLTGSVTLERDAQ